MPSRWTPDTGTGLAVALFSTAVLITDAWRWFTLVPPTASAVVAVLGAVWLVALLAGRRAAPGDGPLRRAAMTVALVALIAFAANSFVLGMRQRSLARAEADWIARETASRSGRIVRDFERLLRRMSAPLETARSDLATQGIATSSSAFHLLDRIDAETGFTDEDGGLSLYEASGSALAWSGSSYPLPPGLLDDLPAGVITFRSLAEDHITRLYGMLAQGRYVLVSEITVASRLDPRRRERVLPALRDDPEAEIRLDDFRTATAGSRRDDRLGDLTPPRGRAVSRIQTADLSAPDGSSLGYARLRSSGGSDLRRRIEVQHRSGAAALLSLLLAALCLIIFAPAPRGVSATIEARPARLASGLALIWIGRVMLSWFPLSFPVGEADLFDASLFASAGLFHLTRSPGDLLLTSFAALATSLLLARSVARLAARCAGDPRRRAFAAAAGWALLTGLAAGAILALPALAREFVTNSAVSVLAVELLSPDPAALALQASAILVLLAIFLMLQSLAGLAASGAAGPSLLSRLAPRPGDGLSHWALAALLPGVLFAALLYDPLLVPRNQRAIESDYESVLMPQVLRQREARRSILRATIDSLEAMPDLPDRVAAGADPTRASMALDIWLRTPLKDYGYNASLLVFSPDGRIISRFARNLPPVFDSEAPEAAGAAPGEPILEPITFLNLTRNIWHAEYPVEFGDQLLGIITVHIMEDFDNVPFLFSEKPYARALTPQVRRITAMPAGSRGVRHAVYDHNGRPVFWNMREPPPLPRDWSEDLMSAGRTRWVDLLEEGRPVRYLFFSDGDHVFTLGMSRATAVERIARTIRMTLLGLGLVGVLLLPAPFLQARGRVRDWWPRLAAALGRTHYRKLLVTFTTVTIFPLMGLSFLMAGYLLGEIEEDIEDRGRQGIQSAGSLVRTILERERSVRPDDDTLYWLSLVAGEDVNLYERGHLVATSRPELFASGLLSRRVDGGVYRRIAVEGRRFAVGRESIKGIEFRTITASVVAEEGRWEGLLSLPLDAQTAAAVLAARDVADATIITFAAMVILTGTVAYVLARRVSRPIRSLGAAAARVAAGDFDPVVGARPRDETGELIASFNRMARALKEQREDLERRKDYIEKILRNVTIGVISMDREGVVVTANPAASTLLDIPGPQRAGRISLGDLIAARPALAPLTPALREPCGSGACDVELSLPGPDGGRTVRARVVPFLEGQGLILLLEDVTETVRSNRLAAWAEMARRIAHEIKNPLTPIQLSAEHIRRVHGEGSPDFPRVLEDCLMTIMAQVAALRQISAEFSAYARIPTLRREPVPMSELLQQVVRPYRTAMPEGIRLEVDVPPGLPILEIDRTLVGRALVNLIENALQAMPQGGTLVVRARARERVLAIEVVDTGVGMDPVALGRIFEPYFSTKDAGTGLGLAIARRTIEEHGGTIEVSSAPGAGTTMRIVLPIAARTAPGPAGEAAGDRITARRE